MFKKFLSLTIIVCFFLTTLGPLPKASAYSVLGLPAPGTMVNLSPAYEPVLIKGLKVHPDNPFALDFIVDTGNSRLTNNDSQLKNESEKLIKYFFAALTLPEKDVWVNLSPYEKDRIVPKATGQTEMGRDMLAQDYILKQITASLIYPEKGLGKAFWEKIYSESYKRFGTTEIPVNTFNKVWIVADKASVYEAKDTVLVVDAHLKVMLEEDYVALQKHSLLSSPNASVGDPEKAHSIASQITRQIILPELEKEVNEGKNFAPLRQIFHSLILAKWYKESLKNALLNLVYSNRNKVSGVNVADKAISEKIYRQYLQAYKKGVFNYIKEDVDRTSNETIPRKYFSGGVSSAMTVRHLSTQQALNRLGSFTTGRLILASSLAYTGQGHASAAMRSVQEAHWDTRSIADVTDVFSFLNERINHLNGWSTSIILAPPQRPEIWQAIRAYGFDEDEPSQEKMMAEIARLYKSNGFESINIDRNSHKIILKLKERENFVYSPGLRQIELYLPENEGKRWLNEQILTVHERFGLRPDKDSIKGVLSHFVVIGVASMKIRTEEGKQRLIEKADLAKEKAALIVSVERIEKEKVHQRWLEERQQEKDASDLRTKENEVLRQRAALKQEQQEQVRLARLDKLYLQSQEAARLRAISQSIGRYAYVKRFLKRNQVMAITTFLLTLNAVVLIFLPSQRQLIVNFLRNYRDSTNSNVAEIKAIQNDPRVMEVWAEAFTTNEKQFSHELGIKPANEVTERSFYHRLIVAMRGSTNLMPQMEDMLAGNEEEQHKAVDIMIAESTPETTARLAKIFLDPKDPMHNYAHEQMQRLKGLYPSMGDLNTVAPPILVTWRPGKVVSPLELSEVKEYIASLPADEDAIGLEFDQAAHMSFALLDSGNPDAEDIFVRLLAGHNAEAIKLDVETANKGNSQAVRMSDLEVKAHSLQAVTSHNNDDLIAQNAFQAIQIGDSFRRRAGFDTLLTLARSNNKTAINYILQIYESGRSNPFYQEAEKEILHVVQSSSPEIALQIKAKMSESTFFTGLGNKDYQFLTPQERRQAIVYFVKDLNAPTKGLREAAVINLGKFKDPKLIPVIASKLQDPDGEVRMAAVAALFTTGDKGAVPHLQKAARIETIPGIRAKIEEVIKVLDPAMIDIKGGIDLNTSNGMKWKVSKDGRGIEMNLDPAMIEQYKREGVDSLSPVIFRMTPISSIWPLVGLKEIVNHV